MDPAFLSYLNFDQGAAKAIGVKICRFRCQQSYSVTGITLLLNKYHRQFNSSTLFYQNVKLKYYSIWQFEIVPNGLNCSLTKLLLLSLLWKNIQGLLIILTHGKVTCPPPTPPPPQKNNNKTKYNIT